MNGHDALMRGDRPGDAFRVDEPKKGESDHEWSIRNSPSEIKAKLTGQGLNVRSPPHSDITHVHRHRTDSHHYHNTLAQLRETIAYTRNTLAHVCRKTPRFVSG
jgi:hypothetical protein